MFRHTLLLCTALFGFITNIYATDPPKEDLPNWKKQAEARIEQHRKADLSIEVLNEKGKAVSGVKVEVELVRHQFNFCGVLSARNFSSDKKEMYREMFKQNFNMAGFENALKEKDFAKKLALLGEKNVIPWLKKEEIPLRGHALTWPGEKHMSKKLLNLCKKEDWEAVKKYERNHIKAHAKRFDVVQWDVLNEPRHNHLVMDGMGDEIIVDWFKHAKKHIKNKDAVLFLNDYQIVTAFNDKAAERHIKVYKKYIDLLLKHNAPIGGMGFQARVKRPLSELSPEQVYNRLNEFSSYNLPIMATELEVMDTDKYTFTEDERAEITEAMMYVYFSHPQVNGIGAWTLFSDTKTWSLYKLDGTVKKNGQVWSKLVNETWHTKESVKAPKGTASVRGFKGTYRVVVKKKGKVLKEVTTDLFDNKKLTIKI